MLVFWWWFYKFPFYTEQGHWIAIAICYCDLQFRMAAKSSLDVLTSGSPFMGISKACASKRNNQMRKHVSPFILPDCFAKLSRANGLERIPLLPPESSSKEQQRLTVPVQKRRKRRKLSNCAQNQDKYLFGSSNLICGGGRDTQRLSKQQSHNQLLGHETSQGQAQGQTFFFFLFCWFLLIRSEKPKDNFHLL